MLNINYYDHTNISTGMYYNIINLKCYFILKYNFFFYANSLYNVLVDSRHNNMSLYLF